MTVKKWNEDPKAWAHAVKLHREGQCLTAIAQTLPFTPWPSSMNVKSKLIRAGEWFGDNQARLKAVKLGEPVWLPGLIDWVKDSMLGKKHEHLWPVYGAYVTRRAQAIAEFLGVKGPSLKIVKASLNEKGYKITRHGVVC